MKSKTNKGITLVSIVITVIILLILASVAISLVTDNDDLFTRVEKVAEDWNTSVTDEQTVPKNEPNVPELLTGMTPVKFTLPEGETAGKMIETNADDPDWYNYEEKRWANAKTADGSLWVWIPRYAYNINPTTQTTDLIFLSGTSDNYYDIAGNVLSAKRCIGKTDVIDTTTGFTVHPAFTDESNTEIGYRNGGWDKELSGIWVAKFEAGYPEGGNDIKTAPVKEAGNLTYSQANVWSAAVETDDGTKDAIIAARNWLDGEYKTANTMAIKYPTFQPLTYSMNYINTNDAFLLCRELENGKEIYGFDATKVDTHMMKDSEWGAVSYISKSAYGLGKTDIYINNITLNSGNAKRTSDDGKTGIESVYAVTGVTEGGADNESLVVAASNVAGLIETATNNEPVAGDTGTRKVYKWNQTEGQKASTTGNMYGIYDLSGGILEISASFVENGHGDINTYGKALADAATSEDTKKYILRYAKGETSSAIDDCSEENYNNEANKRIYGTAIAETSTYGIGGCSWYDDRSVFVGLGAPFSVRGGGWTYGPNAGLFYFNRHSGSSSCSRGFRAVVVAE